MGETVSLLKLKADNDKEDSDPKKAKDNEDEMADDLEGATELITKRFKNLKVDVIAFDKTTAAIEDMGKTNGPGITEEALKDLKKDLMAVNASFALFVKTVLDSMRHFGEAKEDTGKFIGKIRKLRRDMEKGAKTTLKEPIEESEVKLPPTKFSVEFKRSLSKFGKEVANQFSKELEEILKAFLIALKKIDDNDDFDNLSKLVGIATKEGKSAISALEKAAKTVKSNNKNPLAVAAETAQFKSTVKDVIKEVDPTIKEIEDFDKKMWLISRLK